MAEEQQDKPRFDPVQALFGVFSAILGLAKVSRILTGLVMLIAAPPLLSLLLPIWLVRTLIRTFLEILRLAWWAFRNPSQFTFCVTVAGSHLRSRKHEAGVSAITAVSIAGVTIGVTALIMVLAVMEGFEIDLRDKILGSNSHVVVLNYGGTFGAYSDAAEKVQAVEGVSAAAPFVYSEAMIRSAWGTSGVIIKGIDPATSGAVVDVVDNLIVGPEGPVDDEEDKAAALQALQAPDEVPEGADDNAKLPGIIIGQELADQLKVYPGDAVHVINPVGGGIGPMGVPTPKVQPFAVRGIFYSGMYEYDTKWTYVSIPDSQKFLQIGETATGIEARVTDLDGVEPIAEAVQESLGYPFYVRHWKNLNKNLFSALKLEKIVMGLILSLIVMVASLNIVGSLILVVVTRSREIAILRAMGASAGSVRFIFMLEGVLIGVVGTLVGTVLGLLGCEGLKRYEFPLDTDVYYLDTLPVVVEPATVVVVAVSAVAIAFVATLYPARVASEVDPVEGLRYE